MFGFKLVSDYEWEKLQRELRNLKGDLGDNDGFSSVFKRLNRLDMCAKEVNACPADISHLQDIVRELTDYVYRNNDAAKDENETI